MADFCVRSHPAQLARHVHQTAEVTRDEGAGAGVDHGRGLALDDGIRQLAVFHREGPAEPAADVGILHLDEVEAPHAVQELARLSLDAEFPKPRTGIVISDGAVEGGVDRGHAHHVGEERHEFVGAIGQVLGLGHHVGIVGEEFRIVPLDHAGAGTRGRHHVGVGCKCLDHLGRDRLGRGPVAGVVSRLAAAGLDGNVHHTARILQELDGRETDRWPEEVDEAGHEKPDPDLDVGRPAPWCRDVQAPEPPQRLSAVQPVGLI